jgi:hypothetical protein
LRRETVAGFVAVWVAGILLSITTAALAVTGTLWDLGIPAWLIAVTVLVGLWQWTWLFPLLRWARHTGRHDLSRGLLRGGASFSILQLTVWILLFVLFRHVSLQ